MLYEMLTGQPPFKGEYEQAVIYSILNEEPEQVASERPGLRAELGFVLTKALAKNPDARYRSAIEIVDCLQHVRDGRRLPVGEGAVSSAEHRPSIAVLPFANLSGDPEQEYFCEGVAEEIINTLTQVEGLRVVARTSSFSFKGESEDVREIGQKLNVGRLLEGSVRKVGNRVRITAQLVSVADGYRLWSETFDRNMDDIFAIQDEVSLAIVGKLKVGLLDGEMQGAARRHSKDFRAYNLYLHGRYFWSKRTEADLEKALQYFQRAIACDPTYALAYSGLADTYVILHDYGIMDSTEAYQRATDAALKALALDDNLAEAHTSLAGIKTNSAWDWDEAESEYKRAIELNPGYATTHHWYAILLELKGDFENALKEGERALELDPLSIVVKRYVAGLRTSAFNWKGAEDLYRSALDLDPADGRTRGFYALFLVQIGRREEAVSEIQRALENAPASLSARGCYGEILYHMGEYGKAIAEMETAVETSPNSYFARTILGSAYLMSQMYEESLREFRMAQQLSRRDSDSYFHAEAMIGVTLALMGRRDGAQEILDRLLKPSAPVYIPPVTIARLYTAMDETDRAFELLEKAFNEHDGQLTDVKTDPLFDRLRSDERYGKLMTRMGLPE
jgi:serine/threonine-protein kinase